MTTQHTPGPWTCYPTSHHAHHYVLEIPGGNMPFVKGEGVEYANARLIAAAPDLLTALQAMSSSFHDVDYMDPHKQLSAKMAQDAITKAIGEKP